MAGLLTPRTPSKKVQMAIGALLSGQARTQRDAALMAGLPESSFSRALSRQSVKDFILTTIRERLSHVGAIAAARVAQALVDTAESEYVRADMAKFVLGVAGVKPERDFATTNVGSVNLTVVMGGDKLTLIAEEPKQVIDITPRSTDTQR